MTDPINETLPYDSDVPDGTQAAWHAVVHLLVPCVDKNGTTVDELAHAQDYIAETLRGEFLDWGYIHRPDKIAVCQPYVEGTFLSPSRRFTRTGLQTIPELLAAHNRLVAKGDTNPEDEDDERELDILRDIADLSR